ncbi:MAG: hypothetical protein BTN85_1196 [Candidatus Methanohalarchaeum thermophilum]|uniref:Uncharacterized protein n=1 Tax=Methanohalarchaeum thermophilum TaxID=1903181 RepID=A0A1Q6DWG3_METT1|nr:MAG: hypothetical protein BTN85_1196 [Candidatus Methanohalarchaeum thermophilum]
MNVGKELLDVPLPDMVAKLGIGVAEAQHALDENSIEIAKILADTEIEIVPAITRTIKEDTVEYSAAEPIETSLLQVGLNPAFYQFSEATIEVEMDIKTTSEKETEVSVGTKGKVGFGLWSSSISVDVKHNRKFGKEVHGTSKLKTKMVPVPPPPYLLPEVETIDLRTPSTEEEGEE